MKLRSIICVTAIAAVASASALTSTNTFARLPITGNTFENAIIAIPLAGCGETSATIYVTNLVMTTNLAENDKLIYKNRGAFYAWKVNGSGKWESYVISDSSGTSVTPLAEETNLPCGDGCWLVRSGVASRGDSTIYLFGQVNEAAVSTAIAAGTDKGPTYTIVSRPYETGSVELNTWHAENPVAGDTLVVAAENGLGQDTYTWGKDSSNNDGWTKVVVTKTGSGKRATYTFTTNRVTSTISAGTAFMYGRSKNAAATTINWTR